MTRFLAFAGLAFTVAFMVMTAAAQHSFNRETAVRFKVLSKDEMQLRGDMLDVQRSLAQQRLRDGVPDEGRVGVLSEDRLIAL